MTELTLVTTLAGKQATTLSPTARELSSAVEAEIAGVVAGEMKLNRGYARLAAALVRFKEAEVWRELGLSSFNSYLLGMQERYGRSVAQLYVYVGVAEKLLPLVGEKGLDQMGVSKASELTKAARIARKEIAPALIEAALNDKIGTKELRALAHAIYELKQQDLPKGTYFDFGGAYLEPEERATFVGAVEVAIRLLNLPKDMPDWQKRKHIFLAFAQEFDGSHRAEVYG